MTQAKIKQEKAGPQYRFDDYLQAMRTCCVYAQQAATQGRPNAAHGLFQTALKFFEAAQVLAENPFEPQWHEHILHARGELEAHGMAIYRHERYSGPEWHLSAEGKRQ